MMPWIPPRCPERTALQRLCGVDEVTCLNGCIARDRGVIIAHDGECTPVARGSCINNEVLSTVRLWFEHGVLDRIDQSDETEDEEMDEVRLSIVAPSEYMCIRVRLDARQYGIYERSSDGSFRD